MIEKVILTQVYITDKDKQGNNLVNKWGKPYKKIAIKCNEFEEKWLSSFLNSDFDPRNAWKSGHTVKIIVEERGEYLNFRLPSQVDYLESRVKELEKVVFPKGETKIEDIPIIEPEPENRLEDIPF